ncbi:MAG: TadE/TadG family type IV pilus assembly protein [Thiobacillus sp.]
MNRRADSVLLMKRQRGAAAVEFALVAIVFFMLLIGIVEMGRVLFTWNAAVEATRYGARVAVVCGLNDAAILSRMQKIMPSLTTANVVVSYTPGGCTVDTCQQVSVETQNVAVTTLIPISGTVLAVPPFTTTLPRESMLNSIDGHDNPMCS